MRVPVSPVLGAFVSLALIAAGPASSQSYITPPCMTEPVPAFENNLQSLWYRRFWTGNCAGLPFLRCMSGKPNWNDIAGKLVARAPEAQRADVTARACELGRQISLEWSRPQNERRIDTRDLRMFNETFAETPDVEVALKAVEAEVRQKLVGERKPAEHALSSR